MLNVITWAVVLALPTWLLIEEIAHRLPSLSAVPRARRRTASHPAGNAPRSVTGVEGAARA